jgi:hypothetical protein
LKIFLLIINVFQLNNLIFDFFSFRFVGRYDILNGGFCENIGITLTGGIHDKYFSEVARHLSNKTPVTNQMANFYVQNLRSSQTPLNKVVPNVEELYQIIKIAIEQNNIVGCYTNNVSYLI